MIANCPYCNSEQRFPLRHRSHKGSDTVIEVYITCTMCPYEALIRLSTKRMEYLRKRCAAITRIGEIQLEKFGRINAVNRLAQQRVHRLMEEQEALIR